MSLCSKPGCCNRGAAVLAYDYSARLATLEDPSGTGELTPHIYVLCSVCADTLTAPRGWTIDDRRAEPPLFLPSERVHRIDVDVVEQEGEEAPVAVERRQLFFGTSA